VGSIFFAALLAEARPLISLRIILVRHCG